MKTSLGDSSKKTTKHGRTAASENRSTAFDKYPGPNPNGYGTPIVLLYDREGRLILDLIMVKDELFDIALVSFNYTFSEKDEDECTIVLSCSNVALMENLNFYQGQTMRISWGYADGNLRPVLSMVIVDTKERYGEQGYEFTIVMSDNLSYFSKAKSALLAKLEASQQSLRDLLHPGNATIEDRILKLKGWKAYDWGSPANLSFHKGYITHSGTYDPSKEFPRATNTQVQDYLKQLDAFYRTRNGMAPGEILDEGDVAKVSLKTQTDNLSNILERVTDVYDLTPEQAKQTPSGEVPTEPKEDPPPQFPQQFLDEDVERDRLIATLPYSIRGYYIRITGKNAQTLSQNCLDKLSPTPMQVVGRDGKIITYDKNRLLMSTPIREYIFKGGNGHLLEFTYDTDSQYSDDTSVLRQFRVDPETGALTLRDFVNSKEKVQTADTPRQADQLEWDRAVFEGIANLSLSDPAAVDNVVNTVPMRQYSGKVGNEQVLVAYDKEYNNIEKGYEKAVGFYNQYMPAVENATVMQPLISCPNQDLEEHAEETIENEMKAIRRGEQERVKAIAKTLGDPQVLSGAKVLIRGLATRRNGAYIITKCSHIIDNGGYTSRLEMYQVSGISASVNTVTSTTSAEDITKKAQAIKDKKLALHPNSKEIQERGYYLRSDFIRDQYQIEAEKVDKDWDEKLPGTFYEVSYLDDDRVVKTFKVKIPINPNGTAQSFLEGFGYDALYEMLGIHDIRAIMNTVITPLSPISGDLDPTYELNYTPPSQQP